VTALRRLVPLQGATFIIQIIQEVILFKVILSRCSTLGRRALLIVWKIKCNLRIKSSSRTEHQVLVLRVDATRLPVEQWARVFSAAEGGKLQLLGMLTL